MRAPIICMLLALPLLAAPLAAQDPAEVEALAPLLMAEDRRSFDAAAFVRALGDLDSLVRRTAVLSIGRIGDRRGTALLVPMLRDRDPAVVTNTFFALGLLKDTTATEAIATRLRTADSLSAEAVGEAASALDRIGGDAAARFVGAMFSGSTDVSLARVAAFTPNALLDAWRLGRLMPAAAMLHFAGDTSVDLRWRALYSLGRLRIAASGRAMESAVRDASPLIRETAAKDLTRRFADSAGLAASAVKNDLIRALDDDQPGVRISALGSLGTFGDSTNAARISPLLSDADPNARVAAATALGDVKGSVASRALVVAIDKRDTPYALRRAAFVALARCDTAEFIRRAPAWLANPDFRNRITALQSWATLPPRDPAVFRAALADPDARVQAAAFDAWRTAHGDSALTRAARAALHSPDAAVRTAAVAALRMTATADDIDALVAAWRSSSTDLTSDERLAIVATLHAMSRRVPDLLARLDDPSRRDLVRRPDDPVVRVDAARTWPELAARWGSPLPIDTHRTLDDYRSLVRTYLLASDDPHVSIVIDGRGTIDVQLLAHQAPLTVANFLKLVDQRYFDGNTWHRVVPDFVVQDGDRTGTGDGGPGWTIRDEINRERYTSSMLGMALSGPDTGGSQWFINLSPQPHLDAQYTIFGKIAGGANVLPRILQGDVIRSIHR